VSIRMPPIPFALTFLCSIDNPLPPALGSEH
jgi:hypothetical protein